MAKTRVYIEGLRELDAALGQFKPATGKGVLRRVGKKRLQPIADDYKSRVRVDEGDLRDGIGVGTKLTSRQRREHRKMFKDDRASVEIFAGAPGLVQAITEEFGTVDQPAHPGLRPAWDAGKGPLLDGLKEDLWTEIEKTAKRVAKRALKNKG